jgi:hypothetical protein
MKLTLTREFITDALCLPSLDPSPRELDTVLRSWLDNAGDDCELALPAPLANARLEPLYS